MTSQAKINQLHDELKRLHEILDPKSNLASPVGHAAVSICLSIVNLEPCLLMIERADNPNDPWSGQMAFPGGRHEPQDNHLQETALRETHEELGIRLDQDGSFLGCLTDIKARNRHGVQNFSVAPHVFFVAKQSPHTHQVSEVKASHWIPISHLMNPEKHIEFQYPFSKIKVSLPCIEFESNRIWGLSYLMLRDLFTKMHRANKLSRLIELQTESIDFWKAYPTR